MDGSEPSLHRDPIGFLSVPAVILAFTLQPLIRFASPNRVLALGLELFVFFTVYHLIRRLRTPTTLDIGSLILAIGISWGIFLNEPEANASANDRRCLAIQRDMLSAKPHRPDGPDLFQALGCRPQGEGSVYAPSKRAKGQ